MAGLIINTNMVRHIRESSFSSSHSGRIPRTGYHLVDPSPWPILVRAGVINEAASFIRFVHGGRFTLVNFICATVLLVRSFYS